MTKRKINPRSLENLIHEGRPPSFDEPKKRRYLTVTEQGWEGSLRAAKEAGCSGISELLESLGRGELRIAEKMVRDRQPNAKD